MKVSRITLYWVSLDVGTNLTRYAADQSRFSIETMIVRLETDDGLVGWGESCSAPSYYLPGIASCHLRRCCSRSAIDPQSRSSSGPLHIL